MHWIILPFILVISSAPGYTVATGPVVPLGISFTPPSNQVRLGQQLIVRCEITPTDASPGTAGSVPEVSMFLYCPIAPWGSYCFQNCQSACVGVATEECPFDRDLGGITCNTIVTQAGRVIYEYTIPKLTESWMLSKGPGFFCKSAGMSTSAVWISEAKEAPRRLPEEKKEPVEPTTTLPKVIVQEAPKKVPVKTASVGSGVNTKKVETQSSGSVILHELFVIGSIIIVCLSVLLNVFCCIRCALIRQYSRTKRHARMQHTFCMADEIETGRRLNGLLPVRKDSHLGGNLSTADANSLLMPNVHCGSEFHQPLYAGMNAFGDNVSNTTGGEAPSSFMQIQPGRGYQGHNGSIFSLPPGTSCQKLVEKQSNNPSLLTMPVYQTFQANGQQPHQIPVAMTTLQRNQFAQQSQQNTEGGAGEMVLIVDANGQPITVVSGLSGARASLVLESTQNMPDVVSLTSHNTTDPGTDNQTMLPVAMGNADGGDYATRSKPLLLTRSCTVAMPTQHSVDAVPGASHWSDSGNWSGGSGGNPPQTSNGQLASTFNGERNVQRDLLKDTEKVTANHKRAVCLDRMSHTLSPARQHPGKRSSVVVKRLHHYPSHSRRRSGVVGRIQSCRIRDLDCTTEDDVSDWSTSVYGEVAKPDDNVEVQYSVC